METTTTTMNERLEEVIAYKTGGHKTEFCALLGWKPPYLAKLLRGDDFGIKPVRSILAACPEVDARWLLLGTGEMFGEGKRAEVRREVLGAVSAVLELERFMPVMTAEELRRFEGFVLTGGKPDFSPETLIDWEARLAAREADIAARIEAAKSEVKSRRKKICSQPKAKQ